MTLESQNLENIFLKIRLIFLLLVALVVNEKFDPLCKIELEVDRPTESTYLLEQGLPSLCSLLAVCIVHL